MKRRQVFHMRLTDVHLSDMHLILAMDEMGLIGCGQELPWSLPDDLRQFRQFTQSKAVLMGRLTFESIGKPLRQRLNFILSQDREQSKACGIPGAILVSTLQEAYQQAQALGLPLMVIGGAAVYALALPLAQSVYLTRVHHIFSCAQGVYLSAQTLKQLEDTDAFDVSTLIEHPVDQRHPYPYTTFLLSRKKPI